MRTRIWIAIAIALIVIGAVIGGVSFAALDYDYKALNTADYVTTEFEIKEDFRNISLNADTEKIFFETSDNSTCKIVCYSDRKDRYHVGVSDDTLMLTKDHIVKIHMGIVTESPTITVYLPKDSYETLFVDADTGDVTLPENYSFDTVTVKLDTGKINMDCSVSGDISLSTDTGKIYLRNVETDGKLTIRTGTGDVTLEGCDASEVSIKTDTGDVTASFLTEKNITADSNTGKINIPQTSTGGTCEITTNTGNINVYVK